MLDDERQLDGHLAAGGIETAHFLERDRLLVDVGDERSAELRPVPAEGPEKLIGALGVGRCREVPNRFCFAVAGGVDPQLFRRLGG